MVYAFKMRVIGNDELFIWMYVVNLKTILTIAFCGKSNTIKHFKIFNQRKPTFLERKLC